jgi:hypothetical protein
MQHKTDLMPSKTMEGLFFYAICDLVISVPFRYPQIYASFHPGFEIISKSALTPISGDANILFIKHSKQIGINERLPDRRSAYATGFLKLKPYAIHHEHHVKVIVILWFEKE